MQILIKSEQINEEIFIYGWNMANNTEPSIKVKLLESDLYIVNWVLWAN